MKSILFIRLVSWFGMKYIHPRETIFPFSIGYASTILSKRGIKVSIIDTAVKRISINYIIHYIELEAPDMVIIETRCSVVHIAHTICQKARNSHKNTLFLLVGDNSLSGFDGYITGELEFLVPQLIQNDDNFVDLALLQALNEEKEIITDLDSLPHIDYSLFTLYKYKKKSVCVPIIGKKRWGFLLSSRGCPYYCIYCSPVLRNSLGKQYRAHSPMWVLDEITQLKNSYGVNAISFEDDIFTYDRERTLLICEEFKKRNIAIKWVARTRADLLDEELLKKMKEAGCCAIGLGVESGNDRILKLLNKGEKKEDIRRIIKIIDKIGIRSVLYFIIGNPTETYEEMKETFRLAKDLRPLIIQVHYFTPYPGSKIFELLKERELDLRYISHYDGFRYNFSAIPYKVLKQAIKKFYIRYYFSFGYLWKYIRYRLPYVIFDINEIKLILDTLRFLLRRKNEQSVSFTLTHKNS